jgi:hypothetical protein
MFVRQRNQNNHAMCNVPVIPEKAGMTGTLRKVAYG